MAPNPRTGQFRLAADLGAQGTAGALIAECLLAGHLRLGEDTCLATTGAGTVGRISQPARELVATVSAEGPIEVGKWLKYLALKAPADLERAARRGAPVSRRRIRTSALLACVARAGPKRPIPSSSKEKSDPDN